MTHIFSWLKYAFTREVIICSSKVAFFVGTLLMLINYGDKLFSGLLSSSDYLKIILTYFIPYSVSTYTAIDALKKHSYQHSQTNDTVFTSNIPVSNVSLFSLTWLIISYQKLINLLNNTVNYLPALFFRLILAYEFWQAGIMKFHGDNWFNPTIFLFPFNQLSSEMLWFLATWVELIAAIALVLGLATRFFSLLLMILTVIAISAVHWSSEWNSLSELWQGYSISNKGYGNFKLPLLYLIMFMPLLLGGAGKWSLDAMLKKYFFSPKL